MTIKESLKTNRIVVLKTRQKSLQHVHCFAQKDQFIQNQTHFYNKYITINNCRDTIMSKFWRYMYGKALLYNF